MLKNLTHAAALLRRSFVPSLGVLAAGAILGLDARAAIVAPYAADANTLHLWHLDETTVPAIDSAMPATATNLLVLGGSATLHNPSFSGFGTALSTEATTSGYLSALTLVNGAADDTLITYANPTTGAFTYECIVRIDFNPTNYFSANPLYIVTAENEDTHRPWQWGIIPPATATAARVFNLRFFEGDSAAPNNVSFALPTNGPDAMVQSNWYHVAITFSGATNGGTTGTMKWYWTLLDPSRTQADLLGTATMSQLVPLATDTPDFAIGNVGRTTPNGGFVGLIDEVRMSQIERAPTDMVFGTTSTPVTITTSPIPQVVDIGFSVNFSVGAIGSGPFTYQWRTNGTAILNATNATYSIAAVQLTDAANYDVVVSNAVGPVPSSAAALTVRAPLTLTWLGSTSSNWNNFPSTTNWDSDNDHVADSAFGDGDFVIFDDNGSAPIVNIAGARAAQGVTFNANSTSYLLVGSGITGPGGLTLNGSSTVILDNNGNSYSGTTAILNGMLQIGNNDGGGSLGSGPVNDQTTLAFNTTGTVVITNTLSGAGNLVNNLTGTVQLLGSNTFSGNITLNEGTLVVGPNGLGAATNIALNGFGIGNGTALTLGGGLTLGSNITINCAAGPLDNRVTLLNSNGTNIINANILFSGASSIVFNCGSGFMQVNTPVINGPSYSDYFTLRGTSNGVLNSQLVIPNANFQKTDGDVWTISSTNNSYLTMRMLGGTIKLGNDNALATSSTLVSGGGFLDLNGFSQSMAEIMDFTSGTTVITNGSATSDSTFTVVQSGFISIKNTFFNDGGAVGGHRVNFTLDGGGQMAFGNTNTLTGLTTVKSGSDLILNVNGAFPQTTYNIVGGSTLDASYRADDTLTLGTNQVLKGDGAINVLGNVTSAAGVIELKLNKSGSTLANDSLNGVSTMTYGGTLKLDITAPTALTTNDSFKLFNASSYSGAFAALVPGVPAAGLAWDTSTLVTDGTLRLATSTVSLAPTNIVAMLANNGTSLQLSWAADHQGYSLQAQTNAPGAGIGTNWVTIAGSAQTNQFTAPFNTTGSVFYRLIYP